MDTISSIEAASLLKFRKEAIIKSWEAKVRNSIPSTQDESQLSLRDHLPQFIDEIINALNSTVPGVTKDLLEVAVKHGNERAMFSNYSIEESLREFHILRIVIFKCLEDNRILSPEARDAILNCLSLGLAKAGSAFFKMQTEELETSEERLKAALNTSNIGIFDHNIESDIVIWSPEEAEMFGFPRSRLSLKFQEEVKPRIHPEDAEKVETAILKSMNFDVPYNADFRVVWPDGTIRWLEGAGKVLKDSSGRPCRMVGANIDITTDREREDKLRKTIDDLAESELVREKFVSTLSHDLRTPLTSMKISAQLLLKKLPAEFDKTCDKIIKGADRCDDLIQDLLDSNKLKAGHPIVPDIKKGDLVEVAKTVISEFDELHSKRIKLQAPATLPGEFCANGFRRVFENLISNAFKYGSEETPVTVKVKDLKDSMEVSVHNFGTPIHNSEKKHLFDEFHRTSAAEMSGRKGWGIGLSIVKGVAESHCGKVSVRSSPESGTEFCVIVPKQGQWPCSNENSRNP